MSADILAFPDRRRPVRRLPLPPAWWDLEALRLRLGLDTPQEEFRLVRNSWRMGALMLPCPHITCAAPIGEECESESGRRLRDPHVVRQCAWMDLSLKDRAQLAAEYELKGGA